MALDLGDLQEFYDDGMYATVAGTKYPQGKKVRIPAVSGELGLWGKAMAALVFAMESSEDDAERAGIEAKIDALGDAPIPEGQSFIEAMLSPGLHAELIADGVSNEMIDHIGNIVYARIMGGDQMALFIARGGDPKALAANREQRRKAARAIKKAVTKAPATKAAPRASASKTTSTAAGTTTPKPASGSGTKSPRTNAVASRGRKS